MKTIHIISKYVLGFILMMMGAQQLQAQDAFYIYRNDGNFDGFFYDEIVRMNYSKIDLEGEEHDVYVIQEIETNDSLYRIPLAAIDSIGFQQPEIRMNPRFKNMDDLGITPYVTSINSEGGVYHLGISKSIPSNLLPQIGDVVASWDSSVYGGRGFVVKIREESEPIRWFPEENDQSYYWVADPVTELGDVFDQYITVENIGFDQEGNVRRRIAGCNPDGTIRRATEGNKEVTILNLSGTFTREWKPEDDSSISLSSEVGVKLKLRVAYNISWSRLFVKLSRDLIISAKPSLAMSVSRGFDYSIDDFLPFRIPVVIFPATCPIFQTSPIPEWFVRGEGKLEAKLNLPAVQLGIGEDIIIDTRETFPVSYLPRLEPTVSGGVDDALDLGSAEVSLSGYIQTGLKFKANLMTASWFRKIFEGDIGLFLYCGPKVGGQLTYKKDFADDDSSSLYQLLAGSYLYSSLLSLDLEAKATAAALWSDPVEKKFFDKNWSFFTDTIGLVPQFDPTEVIVNGNNATLTIHPKGGHTIGYCTLQVGIYDKDNKLVKTVGDWSYNPDRDANYYTSHFSLDDLKAGVPYNARILLKWAGKGPIDTGISKEFMKTASLEVDMSPLEFGATDNLEKRVRFRTDADPKLIKVLGSGLVKAVVDTLNKKEGIYEAVFTIYANKTPFWVDKSELCITAGGNEVKINFTQKPCLEPIKFVFESMARIKSHLTSQFASGTNEEDDEKTVDVKFTTEKNSISFYDSTPVAAFSFANPDITFTLTPLANDKVKLSASTTSIADNFGSRTITTSVEFTMVLKSNNSYGNSESGNGDGITRYYVFDIEDGKYITKSTLSGTHDGATLSGHQEYTMDFVGKGYKCEQKCYDFENVSEVEFSRSGGDVLSILYDLYQHMSYPDGWGTYSEKGTMAENAAGYNRFTLFFE